MPSFLHSSALLPASTRRSLRPIHESSRDEYGPRGSSTKRLKGSVVAPDPDSEDFLDLVADSLVIKKSRKQREEQELCCLRERTASSDYASEGQQSPPERTAVSPACGGSLNIKDLAKFGSATYNLSDIRSPTPSDSSDVSSALNGHHEAIADAQAAATEWQGESRHGRRRTDSYGQYELADSCEVLPVDSLSQQGASTESLAAVTPAPKHSAALKARKPSEVTFEQPSLVSRQFDGIGESQPAESPDPSRQPPHLSARLRNGKRSASHFSLRSLTESLSKRPRLGIKKLAASVVQGSRRVITQVRQNMRHHYSHGKRDHEARRSQRRQEPPAGAAEVKTDSGLGAFVAQKRRPKNEEWWTEGVKKYRAPSWARFR
ncbi:hypothetical protein LIA77_07066 [Sarocladium implicatum]|nr:hypothetical protein LIA77_07066 [Sarocladium implicatum]